MEISDKIRLFNGVGSWKTYTAHGTVPQITMSDGPHGLRKQEVENYADLNKSNVATCFPTASCIASSWNRDSLKRLGSEIAREALAENVHLVLGCGMNIKRSPLCGRNFEYFSEDPYLSGELAASYVNGMQKEGVGACIKHFACNNQEKRRQTSSSNVDERALREIYLRGFEIAVKKSQPVSIMCSYNKVNGVYAAHNRHLLTEILRNEWGFNGAVISDWGACIDAPKCLKAGMDLAMPDSNGYFDMQIKEALEKGELTEAELDTANNRLIEMAGKLTKMRENRLAPTPDKAIYPNLAEQYQKALELACDSAVLLKNDGMLPLSLEKNRELCVIGQLAVNMKFQAGGSSHITVSEYPDAVQLLQEDGFSVTYSAGYYSGFCKRKKVAKKNAPLQKKALELVRAAAEKNIPVLFFCGLTDAFEGEGFDRKDMELPPEQLELLESIMGITENVIILSFSGAPVDLVPVQKAKAVLHMYLCGEACGRAVVDLLTGKVTPSGKLAETWPLKIEDTPCHGNFAPDHDEVDYDEGLLVGYRWYEERKLPVQYPFGYGLSYTSFEYSDLKVTAEKASLKVKNTGSRAGAEIVQLYVTRAGHSYKELRGFEKIFLKPGEEKLVEITLDDNAFKIFSEAKNCFVQIKGDYLIEVGASIKDIRLSTDVTVDGEELADNVIAKDEGSKSASSEIETVCSFANAKLQANAEQIDGNQKATAFAPFATFTISDSLGDMAASSWRIRMLIQILTLGLVILNKGKSREDPAIKIAVAALVENPLESLISTSGGAITYKFAKRIVKWANKGKL